MYALKRNAMKGGIWINTPYDECINRAIHINGNVMMMRRIIEKQWHIEAIWALGQLAILLV